MQGHQQELSLTAIQQDCNDLNKLIIKKKQNQGNKKKKNRQVNTDNLKNTVSGSSMPNL